MARAEKFSLREWRNVRHLTIEQMAVKMGVSPSTYSKWERHITTVKLGDLARILNVLEVGPEQVKLFLNEEEPEDYEDEKS
jgi:transcriptional regulator with XRE-family HTH domain